MSDDVTVSAAHWSMLGRQQARLFEENARLREESSGMWSCTLEDKAKADAMWDALWLRVEKAESLLREREEELTRAKRMAQEAMNELGVPEDTYPAPVANAHSILENIVRYGGEEAALSEPEVEGLADDGTPL